MQLTYHKWLTIKIAHNYFNDGTPNITIAPTAETAQVFQNNNLVSITVDNAYEFYIGVASDTSASIPTLNHLGTLTFNVFVEDSLFFGYTDLPLIDHQEQLYLFQHVATSAKMVVSVTQQDPETISRKPFGLLQVNTAMLQTNSLTLHFNARKVFFKYYVILLSNISRVLECKIINQQQEAFNGPITEVIETNQSAQVFTSKKEIALTDTITNYNTLFLTYLPENGDQKELELTLPNPSPQNLQIQTDQPFIAPAYIYI